MSEKKAEIHTLSSLSNKEIQTIEQLTRQSKKDTEELLGTFNELMDQSLSSIENWDEIFQELNQQLLENYQTNANAGNNIQNHDQNKYDNVILNSKGGNSDSTELPQSLEEPINEYYANYMDANIIESRVFNTKQNYSIQNYLIDLVLDEDINLLKKATIVTLHEKSVTDYGSLFNAVNMNENQKLEIFQDVTIFLERYNAYYYMDWLKNLLYIKDPKYNTNLEKQLLITKELKGITKPKEDSLFLKRLELNLDDLSFNKFQYKLFQESACVFENTFPPPNVNIANTKNLSELTKIQEEEPKLTQISYSEQKLKHIDQQLYDLFYNPNRLNVNKAEKISNNEVRRPAPKNLYKSIDLNKKLTQELDLSFGKNSKN